MAIAAASPLTTVTNLRPLANKTETKQSNGFWEHMPTSGMPPQVGAAVDHVVHVPGKREKAKGFLQITIYVELNVSSRNVYLSQQTSIRRQYVTPRTGAYNTSLLLRGRSGPCVSSAIVADTPPSPAPPELEVAPPGRAPQLLRSLAALAALAIHVLVVHVVIVIHAPSGSARVVDEGACQCSA